MIPEKLQDFVSEVDTLGKEDLPRVLETLQALVMKTKKRLSATPETLETPSCDEHPLEQSQATFRTATADSENSSSNAKKLYIYGRE